MHKFTVVDAKGNSICIIEAEDHAKAQEFLKFNTPGSTFDLKVIAYNGREAPTHADWVNATLARIEEKHGKPLPPFRYVVLNADRVGVCHIDAVNLDRAVSILGSAPFPVDDLIVGFGDRETKTPSFADWVKLVTTPVPPQATQGEAGGVQADIPVVDEPLPTPEPTKYAWSQPVWVDADTENKRPGIVAWDQPSVTDRSWFVSMPGGVLQWTRAGRLTPRDEGKVVEKVVEKVIEVPRQAWRLPEPGDVVRVHWGENEKQIIAVDWGRADPIQTDDTLWWFVSSCTLVRLHDAPPASDPSLGGPPASSPESAPATQEQTEIELAPQADLDEKPEFDFSGHSWIKVKKFKHDDVRSVVSNYARLQEHHCEETTFLINKVRELAGILNEKSSVEDSLVRHLKRFADAQRRCRILRDEMKEATRYIRSCPDHVEATLKTIAFRLDCLARGVEPESPHRGFEPESSDG